MTVQLDLPSDVVDRLTEEARKSGFSLDAYLLQTVLQLKGANGAQTHDAEKRRKRADAGARILEIQKRVKPDPEGWTSRDYINYGAPLMAAVVIDASIASAWCFPDEQTDYTKAVFQAISSSAVDTIAPRLWAYEIRNSVLMGLRRSRISKSDSEQFLISLNELTVRLSDPESYDDVFSLAHEHGLTVYDAAYLALAIQERLPLASLDGQLVRAAQKVGVPLF